MSKRIAQLAPVTPVKSIQDILDRLHKLLESSFNITALNTFNVFVEGWTDVKYLERAVELARNHLHEELLVATDNNGAQTTSPCLPWVATKTRLVGADRLADLAEQIKSYQDVSRAFLFSSYSTTMKKELMHATECGLWDIGLISTLQR